MKFSTKIRYGIRAMIEIEKQGSEKKTVFQKDIAENQEISIKYLDHIIHSLKVAGLIGNIGGRKSGYKLLKPADQITLYDIHNAFEPDISVIDCMSDAVSCNRSIHCAAQEFWGGLNDLIINYFKSYTLEDLVKKQIIIDDQI